MVVRWNRPITWAAWRVISRQLATEAQLSHHGNPHTPVLLEQTLHQLCLRPGQTLMDMTFGAGGHSLAALKSTPSLKVIAVDRDPVAHRFANDLSESFPGQVTPLLAKFSDVPVQLQQRGIPFGTIDAVLFDLGASSMQFDNGGRGFSLSKDGPLDMRMDPGTKITAADVIAHASEEDLRRIFKYYGDEKQARPLARALVEARFSMDPIRNTHQLAKLVELVLGFSFRQDKLRRRAHVATKVFQALRIFVNNEINELNYGMLVAHRCLRPGGRIAAISFHSLEDRVVKRQIQDNVVDNAVSVLPLRYSHSSMAFNPAEMSEFRENRWRPLHKHVILPSDEEVSTNPRARSARLRVAVKN